MHKTISIICDDALQAQTVNDAIDILVQDLKIDVNVKREGQADITICAEPFTRENIENSFADDNLDFLIYIGASRPDDADKFDYKFYTPLRLGLLLDRVASLFSGRAGGQVARKLNIKNWQITFPENELVSWNDNARTELTDTECQLLRALYVTNEQGLSKQDLLDSVWGWHQDVETHTLETHIYRLRQKLESDPASPEVLVTTDDGYVLKR